MGTASRASITLFCVFWVWMAANLLDADVIETKGGAHLVGKVTRIADGKVYLDTDYAGPLVVFQTQIVRIDTDGPVMVRLADGRRYDGRLSGTNGWVEVTGPAGPVSTTVAGIAASWGVGAPDPQTVKSEYHWAYEAAVDLNGKTGNHNQLGSAYGMTATLTRRKDTLVVGTNYSRQVTDGLKSADQLKIGADYSENYSDKNSWYARDEAGFDRMKDIGEYNLAATGAGCDFVRRLRQTLTGRLGVAYRYEDYTDSATRDEKSIGLDLGANYTLHMANALLITRLAIVPTFQNLANVRVTHETDFDIPLSNSAWKVRLGVSNDFTSKPADDVEKLDSTYFGRLVLSWK